MRASRIPDSKIDIEGRAAAGLARMQSSGEAGRSRPGLYGERLSSEIAYLRSTGLGPYIAAVTELVDYARSVGIVVGPGRGSAPSALLLYFLGVTGIDPVANGLIVERWLSHPGIEIDVEWHRKQELVDYLWSRYGAEHTAYITAERRDEETGERTSREIHAASYAICSEPIAGVMPTRRAQDGRLVIDADRDAAEAAGMGIVTILGLKPLTVIAEGKSRIQSSHPDVRLSDLSADDEVTMHLFRAGATEGVFQFSYPAMREALREVQPRRRSELHALNAAYRPAFLTDGLFRELVRRMLDRNGIAAQSARLDVHQRFPEDALYDVEAVREAVADTFGLMLFQEQFIAIVRRLSGWSAREAERYRRRARAADGEGNADRAELQDELIAVATERAAISKEHKDHLRALIARSPDTVLKSHVVAYAAIGWMEARIRAHFGGELGEFA